MIRIDLVDNTASIKHIDFCVVPVTQQKDFTCDPDGTLSLRSVVQLSRKLRAGRVSGRMGKYVWYRLLGKPPGRHESPLDKCR